MKYQDVVYDFIETIWIATWPELQFIYISPELYEITGYSVSEFEKDPALYQTIFPPEDLIMINELIKSLKVNQKESFEFRIRHKNGSYFLMGCCIKLVEYDNKKFVFSVVYDLQNKRISELDTYKYTVFLQKVIDTVPENIFVRDKNGRFAIANQAVANWYETTVDDLIGKTDYDFNPNTKEVDLFVSRDQTVFRTNEELTVSEEEILDVHGNSHWIKTKKVPIVLDSGEKMVLGICIDITETKIIQQKIEEQNKIKELLLHLATEFIHTTPEKVEKSIMVALEKIGTFVQADRVYILKYLYEKEIARNVYEWCSENTPSAKNQLPEVPLDQMDEWVIAHSGNQKIHYPNISLLEEGPLKTILQLKDTKALIAVPVCSAGYCHGSIGFDFVRSTKELSEDDLRILELFAGMLAQVYDSIKAKKEIVDYQKRIDDILQEIPGSIWSVSWPDKQTLYISPSASELYKRPMSELIGNRDTSFEFGHPEDLDIIRNAVSKMLTEGFAESQYRIIRGDGSCIWLNTKMKAVIENGQVIRVHGIDADITQQKEAEKLLEMASKAKSRFLANMSHELRTPLTTIQGFSETLEATDLDEDQKNMLDHIMVAAKTLKDVVGNILDISKIEAGKMELYPKSFNVEKLIKQTVSLIEFQAKRKNIALILNIEKNIPHLYLDPVRLQQVLLNLLANAVKFVNEGSITVTGKTTSKDPLCVYFEVSDTGIGIPKDHQEIIFQQFQQVDGSPTRRYGGAGLGLTICSEILHLMGSEIHLVSESNAGSTFYFTVCSSKSVKKEEIAAKLRIPLSSKVYNILFVEDDPPNTIVLKSFLKRIIPGSKLIGTHNGEQALSAFSRDIDLVIMDLHMPVMDGWTAASKIRAIDALVPIIAVTASADDHSVKKAYDMGCSDFLSKPYSLVTLAAIIGKWLP